jgi:predicted RNA-binding protein with PIN domain
VAAGVDHDLDTVHARGDGDSAITSEARSACARGDDVTVVTADRLLQAAVHAVGARTMSPSWLLDQLGR